jgi:hypothetical protein
MFLLYTKASDKSNKEDCYKSRHKDWHASHYMNLMCYYKMQYLIRF